MHVKYSSNNNDFENQEYKEERNNVGKEGWVWVKQGGRTTIAFIYIFITVYALPILYFSEVRTMYILEIFISFRPSCTLSKLPVKYIKLKKNENFEYLIDLVIFINKIFCFVYFS